MKILLLSQVLPHPPDSGPKVKTWNLLRFLAQHHEVTLISFVRGEGPESTQELQKYCRRVHTIPMKRAWPRDLWALVRSLATSQPWMMLRDDRRAMRDKVREISGQGGFDVVYADQLNMCQYARLVSGGVRVFDAHNALWLLYRRVAATLKPGAKRWLLKRDEALLKRYEARVCQDFDVTTAVSIEDKHALEEAIGKTSGIVVIPIGVDTQEMSPIRASSIPTSQIPTSQIPSRDRVTYVGTMFWPPNVDGVLWFRREIWPLVRRRRPDAELDIIGARPPGAVTRLASTADGVHIAGYVADLQERLAACGVFVVPLRAGGGMRVKILEALSRGLPIVSTSVGCEGIHVTHEKDILIADTPEEFAEATVRILSDLDLRRRLAENGRRLVEEEYDYRTALRPLDAILSHPPRGASRG